MELQNIRFYLKKKRQGEKTLLKRMIIFIRPTAHHDYVAQRWTRQWGRTERQTRVQHIEALAL